ncbi:MAG: TraR/DksA C4-type zinc finger protein [Bacteriovoracaceae bacterium]|nr:TraR/DksA C4-type zinc finger protein [Bacteroidota bacterium]
MAKKVIKKAKSKPAKKASRPKTSVAKMKSAPAKPVKKKLVKGFNAKELTYFKGIITDKRREILEELAILKESMMDVTTGEYASENSTYSTHMEQGTDAMEREKTFLFASREGKFLNYLDDALKRIDKGTYGFCINCGKLIPKARLEAVPHAQLCIECKNLKKGSM